MRKLVLLIGFIHILLGSTGCDGMDEHDSSAKVNGSRLDIPEEIHLGLKDTLMYSFEIVKFSEFGDRNKKISDTISFSLEYWVDKIRTRHYDSIHRFKGRVFNDTALISIRFTVFDDGKFYAGILESGALDNMQFAKDIRYDHVAEMLFLQLPDRNEMQDSLWTLSEKNSTLSGFSDKSVEYRVTEIDTSQFSVNFRSLYDSTGLFTLRITRDYEGMVTIDRNGLLIERDEVISEEYSENDLKMEKQVIKIRRLK